MKIEEADKLLYEKAYSFATHLSYVFYVILGFFVAITAWYFQENNKELIINSLNIENIISIIMLIMLMVQAKISRLSEDNQDLMKDFEDKYKRKIKIKFNSTGIKGIGDFLSYSLLVLITSHFIINAFNEEVSLKSLFKWYFILMIMVYYLLANGDFIKNIMVDCIFGKEQDKKRRKNKKHKLEKMGNIYFISQTLAYIPIFIIILSLLYCNKGVI